MSEIIRYILPLLSAAMIAGCDGTQAASDDSGSSRCRPPVLSEKDGTYNKDLSVSITCETAGATIYYTTDESSSALISKPYRSAISVSGNGTKVKIKAVAVKDGMGTSAVVSSTYHIKYDASSEAQSSDIEENGDEVRMMREKTPGRE